MDIADKLFSAALEVRSRAHAPYSGFKVGAALYADDLQIYKGCNVENVSFPCGTCAEAGAIADMVAHGASRILEIMVVADSQNLITPCGACLQRIAEFADAGTLVHLADFHGHRKTMPLNELLPQAFTTGELQK